MKLFTQILILIGFVITMVKVTAESDEKQLLTPDKGLYVNPSEVVFSAESDYLVIPDGSLRGAVISKQKLGKAIAEQFEDISEVNDISIVDEFHFIEGFTRTFSLGFADIISDFDVLTISFRITTNKDSDTGFYPYIQCWAYGSTGSTNYLKMSYCESENVEITQQEQINIPIPEINVSIDEYTDRNMSYKRKPHDVVKEIVNAL